MEMNPDPTYVQDQRINRKVVEIIEELKAELISRFHPKSIIMIGSFGSGEATVVEESGKLKFLSDCEVLLIPYKWIFNKRKLDDFEKEFYEKTGLKVEIFGFNPTLYVYLPFVKPKPTISLYDLKFGSKVIYGKNYLEKMPEFKPEDIPLWEGIRLLFNRMAEALEHFSLENPTAEMIFWTDKIVLACQDALLLLIGSYTPSYKERNRIFLESIDKFDFPNIQELASLAENATNRKLNLNSTKPSDAIVYWFQVSKMCNEVLKCILKVVYKCEFGDYLKFQKIYFNLGLQNYTTLPFNNTVLQNLFRFLKKLILNHDVPNLRMILLRPFAKWDHVIYSHIPLLYFIIDESLEINKIYLKKVANLLRDLGFKFEFDDHYNYPIAEWMLAKDIFIKLWRQMRL